MEDQEPLEIEPDQAHSGNLGIQTLATATGLSRDDLANFIRLGRVGGRLTHVVVQLSAGQGPCLASFELSDPSGQGATIDWGWVRGASVTGGFGQMSSKHEVSFPPDSRLFLFLRNDTGSTVNFDMWAWWVEL